MFEPISLVVGGGLVAGGWVAGRLGRRRPARIKDGPVCGCGHDLALHDATSNECHADVKRSTNGVQMWVRCHCRRYTGPQPLTDFYAPPLLPPLD